MKNSYKKWTETEILFLKEHWGVTTLSFISESLGRTLTGIRHKACLLKLGHAKDNQGYITKTGLARVCKVTTRTIDNWIKAGLSCKEKNIAINRKYFLIGIDSFWTWGRKNKDKVVWSRLEKNALGKEPGWVAAERLNTKEKFIPWKEWTNNEDLHLVSLLKIGLSTNEISERMNRTPKAIAYRKYMLHIDRTGQLITG